MGAEVSGNVHENYIIRQKQLGKGTYGTVHKGVRKTDKKRVAVKVLKKKHILAKASLVEKLQREILIMQKCDHPNVVSFYDYYVHKTFVFIVIEYMPGGDLLEYLNYRGRPINPGYTATYMRQALTGLQYLHGMKIVHRDIKPENLLLTADRQMIKLADFGLSHESTVDNQMFYTMCGSLTHIAPEVFQGKGYGHNVDIWSLGVVLYVMLSVSYPFQDDNRNELIKKIIAGKINFDDDPIWEGQPMAAKDLITLMLNTDPDTRITLEQCLDHDFLNPNKKARTKPKKTRVNNFKDSKKLASSRAMALNAVGDPNEEELEEINLAEDDPDEEAEDERLQEEQKKLAESADGYMAPDHGMQTADAGEEEVNAAKAGES